MTIYKQETTIDPLDFRQTLGLFATGVTVIAVEVDGILRGMTANAVTSVSLDPPLVLVCVQKDARMVEYLKKSSGFSINILTEDHADLSNYFANLWSGAEPPEFNFLPWEGGPRLQDALGAIACQTQEFLEGGDHWIVLGRVTHLYRPKSPGRPLLYYTGRYRRLAENPPKI